MSRMMLNNSIDAHTHENTRAKSRGNLNITSRESQKMIVIVYFIRSRLKFEFFRITFIFIFSFSHWMNGILFSRRSKRLNVAIVVYLRKHCNEDDQVESKLRHIWKGMWIFGLFLLKFFNKFSWKLFWKIKTAVFLWLT
jgi:hypothetical protein